MQLIDLTGKRFGRLIVLSKHGHTGKEVTWLCKCDCGNETVVMGNSLRKHNTMSCGCYHRDRARESNIKHGGSARNAKTILYSRWEGIKKRCYSPGCKSFKNYGGRGIKMCDEWRNDYSAFETWALKNGFKKELTIERVDVNGNYCPENCTWIPKSEQSKNRRNIKRG